jgi:hypothetical protein
MTRLEYVDGPREGEVRELDGPAHIEVVVGPPADAASGITIVGWYYPLPARFEGTVPLTFQASMMRGPILRVPADMDEATFRQLEAEVLRAGLPGIEREG